MNSFGFPRRPIEVSVFGRSDTGRRRSDNQDDFLIADLSAVESDTFRMRPDLSADGVTCGRFNLGEHGALLLVADGMGGAAGSLASRLASTWIHDEMVAEWLSEPNRTPQRFASTLCRALERTNARLHLQTAGDTDLRGIGTTTTAVGLLEDFLYLAQVGDSRAYLVRGGEAIQLTRDQSVVQALIEAGALSELEAESSAHSTTILQAIGTEPHVQVDLTYQQARRGDVVILCSDGLFRVVRREEIGQIVDGTPDLVVACDSLIALANERGGPDNITVVMARLEGDGLGPPASGEAIGRKVLVLPDP